MRKQAERYVAICREIDSINKEIEYKESLLNSLNEERVGLEQQMLQDLSQRKESQVPNHIVSNAEPVAFELEVPAPPPPPAPPPQPGALAVTGAESPSPNPTPDKSAQTRWVGVIGRTQGWFEAAGQMQTGVVNFRQAAFYTGMQLEEISEKLTCILGLDYALVQRLLALAAQFKEGIHDVAVEKALRDNPMEMLDGDLDIMWVTIGAATAQGADVPGSYTEVGRANWEKFPDGVAKRDANGKVIKPADWMPPDLRPYVNPKLLQG